MVSWNVLGRLGHGGSSAQTSLGVAEIGTELHAMANLFASNLACRIPAIMKWPILSDGGSWPVASLLEILYWFCSKN